METVKWSGLLAMALFILAWLAQQRRPRDVLPADCSSGAKQKLDKLAAVDEPFTIIYWKMVPLLALLHDALQMMDGWATNLNDPMHWSHFTASYRRMHDDAFKQCSSDACACALSKYRRDTMPMCALHDRAVKSQPSATATTRGAAMCRCTHWPQAIGCTFA